MSMHNASVQVCSASDKAGRRTFHIRGEAPGIYQVYTAYVRSAPLVTSPGNGPMPVRFIEADSARIESAPEMLLWPLDPRTF